MQPRRLLPAAQWAVQGACRAAVHARPSAHCALGPSGLPCVTPKLQNTLLQDLLEHKLDVNVKGEPRGDTPLHAAVEAADQDIVEMLLEQ